MDVKRINELSTIIDDANNKMSLIEEKLLADGPKNEDHLLTMFYMNMDRRTLCMEEITKLKSGRV